MNTIAGRDLPDVNAHMHTPYSFSAFRDIDDALDRAVAEGVKVVGINDFYTTQGYDEWADGCRKRGLYPLFGIEFISLNETDQKARLRVNDPANPGRTYLSGKGLAYPFRLQEPYASQLAALHHESNRQVEKMCEKLNDLLHIKQIGIRMDVEQIRKELTRGSLRERHLARALRLRVYDHCKSEESQIRSLLGRLFGGKPLQSALDDHAAVENEIRANLLKAGGVAFVPEEPTAFLPVEGDLERVAKQLTERGIHSVEFITTRNDLQLLEQYASYLHEQGFVVTFGSEHNSPMMEPIRLLARGGVPLTERLREINYEGACVIVAHQHLVAQGLPGYVNEEGEADRSRRDEYLSLGAQLIEMNRT